MSLEFPKSEPGKGETGVEIIDIQLPADIDPAWCADFNVDYGHGRMSTTVWAVKYDFEAWINGHDNLRSRKSYHPVWLGIDGDDPVQIRGLISRVGMRQDPHSYASSFQPYIGLTQVEDVGENMPLYYHPDQEFIVSLENCDQLILHSNGIQSAL